MTVNLDQYRAANETIAWIDRSARARLDVSGPDAAKFLHNLTTNDIKRLPVERGCEAFITSPQGKTLAYVSIIVRPGSILVRADAGGLDKALPHLQKYGIFDDVAIEDVSDASVEYHVAGPEAAAWLESQGASLPGPEDLSEIATQIQGVSVYCIRESPTGRPGFTLIASTDEGRSIGELLRSAGLTELDADTFDTLRIEAGTPVFGREVDEKNLPQEIDRDPRTISFVKGCYLGQETVARLDALGHVNKILRGLRFPPRGTDTSAGDSIVGRWENRRLGGFLGVFARRRGRRRAGDRPSRPGRRGIDPDLDSHRRRRDVRGGSRRTADDSPSPLIVRPTLSPTAP